MERPYKVSLIGFAGCTGCSKICQYKAAVRGDSHRAAKKAKDIREKDLYGCNNNG